MKHIKYRPDIDGLRAIAILSVVIYHAFPTKIPGGFIGVDIFFVISGFLISNILFKNFEANNFSYKEFYARRIKRIFPALILVVFFNLWAGWYLLFPDEFKQLGKHVVGGSGFVSNILLWVEAGYFDKASEAKPLLHLWSLSVEEQFYIFWPILLGVFWRRKLNLLFVILSIAIISFFLSLYTLNNFSVSSAFYLPFNRFWELMVGGVLAYIYTKDIINIKNSYINVQSVFGVILIILSLVFIDEYKYFPGAWALLPTIGAFLLILSRDSLINNYILSNRILVYIGLISYPLYLWHWSLLSFAHILNITARNDRIIIVLLSFLLSIITYEFLEKKVKNIRKITSILVISSVALALFGMSIFMGIISPRNNSSAVNLLAEAVMDWEYPEGLSPQSINEVQIYAAGNKKNKVLFYGDSHLEQYSPRIVKLLKDKPLSTKSVVFATRGGCPPIPNVFEELHHPWCTRAYKNVIEEYALSEEVDSVVIGFADSYFMNIGSLQGQSNTNRYYYSIDKERKYFDQGGVKDALQSLRVFVLSLAKIKKVFLLIDNPSGDAFDPKNLFIGNRITGLALKSDRFHLQEYGVQQQEIRRFLIDLGKHNNVIIIDPIKHFCENNQCITMLSGKPIYKDSNHIRPFYVRDHIKYMDVTVEIENKNR